MKQMLSPHFSLDEMIANGAGLPNTPPSIELGALQSLCVCILEPIRAHFGKPVKINSGYRSPAVNKSVGGAATSQHAKGEAADIEIPGISNADIVRYVLQSELPFDQMIAEYLKAADPSAGWVHISYRSSVQRRELISSVGKDKNGKVIYLPGLHIL